MHAAIVRSRYEYIIRIHSQGINNGIVAYKVLHEVTLGTLPQFNIVRRGSRKGVQFGMQNQPSDTLLVVGQGGSALAGRQVPEFHSGVMAGRDHLWLRRLTFHS